MPLSPIGVLHTIIGSLAIICGLRMLWQDKQISFKPLIGKLYLLASLFTAGSALTIFKHGGFNAAHGLAVLTILAIVVGVVLEKTEIFKSWNKYFVNVCFSSTLLFHLIPTATEIMTRFPMDNPMVNSLEAPLLKSTFLAIFVVFVVMLGVQIKWLRDQD